MNKIQAKPLEKLTSLFVFIASFFIYIYKTINPQTVNEEEEEVIVRNRFEKKLFQMKEYTRANFYFVSTDIVDSTRLWNVDPKTMSKHIEFHHRIGSILIHNCEGYESKKEGDAYFAVFENGLDAFRFANEFQNALKGRLMIRIGICEGEALIVKVDEKYIFIGEACNKANFICNAGDRFDFLISGYNYFPMPKKSK
ncbi:hypothetical protein COBT_003082 [Conglomerata obtusa]